MNQLVETLINLSHSPNHYAEMGKLILSYISKYEINITTTILTFVIVILGSLLFQKKFLESLSIFTNYVSNQKPKPTVKLTFTDYKRTRSWIVRDIHGGKPILDRLKEDFNKANVNPATLDNTEKLLEALLQEEYLDLIKLQEIVAKLEMRGSEDSAVKILEEAVKRVSSANNQHQAYEIEMFLVEMLIYKRELEKALNCPCLKDDSLQDARRPLYKAIIHQMKGNKEKARECWEEFLRVRDPTYFVDQNRDSCTFDEFKTKVKHLKSAIKKLHGKNEHKNV